ncbi:MAG TPA: hypothetical protein VE987_13090 [Polyangiaceae bacterium]|nr:hypothetical protein [Polyangiaceae bacterium]
MLHFPSVARVSRLRVASRKAVDRLRGVRWTTLRHLAPGMFAVACAPFLFPLFRMEIKEPLFGDTAIFQYTAWCIRHGMRLYRDVGTADGPFIHYLQAAMQAFAGITDRGFRIADLVVQSVGSACIGALLAPTAGLNRPSRLASRVAWAALAAVVWFSWYLDLAWSETTERETYYALFGGLGMALAYASDRMSRRLEAAALLAGSFVASTQAFGKPTGVVYPAMVMLCAALPSATSTLSRRARVVTVMVGAAACVLAVLVALLVSGSVKYYFFWCWKIPYVGNRYLYGMSWYRLFLSGWDGSRMMAVTSLVVGTGAIATDFVSVRALSFVLVPPILFVGACLQGRGYGYHFAPVTAGFHLLLLLGAARLWEQGQQEGAPGAHRGLVPVLGLAFLGYYCFQDLQVSPFRWNGDESTWTVPANHFAEDEKSVGRYVKENTRPTDLIFAYGAGENASIVMLYAERRTASPFFHSFWLDPVGMLPMSENKPGPKELEALTKLEGEIRDIACQAVEQKRPEVMTFNLLPQVFKVCPNIEHMLAHDYDDATTIGSFHVYRRRSTGFDAESAVAGASTRPASGAPR